MIAQVQAKPGSIDAVTFFMSLGVVGGGAAEAAAEPVKETAEDEPLEKGEKREKAPEK